MQLKKISATMLITISGSLLSAGAMSSRLEEVTVTGSPGGVSREPNFTASRIGGGGSGSIFSDSNPNFSFGNPNLDRIAEEERQRLKEEKKERDKKEKESCKDAAATKFDTCKRTSAKAFQLRIKACPDRTFTFGISRGPNSIGYEYTNRDMNCVRDTEATRDLRVLDCENTRNSTLRNCP